MAFNRKYRDAKILALPFHKISHESLFVTVAHFVEWRDKFLLSVAYGDNWPPKESDVFNNIT